MQIQNDKLVPIEMFSKAFGAAEQNWHISELEAFAIVKSITHWCTLLKGKHFAVLSDHKPLEAIFQLKGKDAIKRIIRWQLSLQIYNFTVYYQPGANAIIADYYVFVFNSPFLFFKFSQN